MEMKVRNFKYIIKQGFTGLWRNKMSGIASIGSVTAVLIILGIISMLVLNMNNLANVTKKEFDEIHVYLEDGLSEEEMTNLNGIISDYDGVLSVIFQSKAQALELWKEEWGDQAYLLEGVEEDNPLPNSYIIQLEDIEYASHVVENLKALKGIEEIKYYNEILDKLIKVADFVRVGGVVVIGILILISIFIISNTIKLAVAARKREINIMKYVGSTNGFIRGPFIIEGIILGLIGSILSILVINYSYKYLFEYVNDKFYSLFMIYLIPAEMLADDIIIMFLAIGVGIGMLGSIISLRKFLKV